MRSVHEKCRATRKREAHFPAEQHREGSERPCLAGHPVQSGGRAECNIKNERRGRFISHFHFLITVSAYRGSARSAFLTASSPAVSFPPGDEFSGARSLFVSRLRALFVSLSLSLSLRPSLPPSFFLSLSLSLSLSVPLSGNNFTYRLHWSPYHCFISLQWRRGEWAGLPRPSPSGDLHERIGKIAARSRCRCWLPLLLLSCRSKGRLSEQQQQRSLTALSALSRFYYRTRRQENIW